uniref:Fiber protein Fb34 n=1 Tax=Rhizophora mucronata TaxID=61149 RepID=A0A2P2ISY2_RHIMU
MASIIVLVVVFVFDVIAFSLAVAAEQRRNTASVVTDGSSNYCQYDSDIATGLGVGAFLFLMASQALIMVASRCLCFGKAMRPSRSRTWAIVLFITCWIFFCIAEVCLLAGSVRNAYHTKYYVSSEHSLSCQELRKGVFGAAAAFIVFTGIVSEFYYVNHSRANNGQPSYPGDSGVRMGTL